MSNDEIPDDLRVDDPDDRAVSITQRDGLLLGIGFASGYLVSAEVTISLLPTWASVIVATGVWLVTLFLIKKLHSEVWRYV